MTEIVRATAAEDLLALIPQLTGRVPRSSLVVVLFGGSRSRGVLQVHLPSGTGVSAGAADAAAHRVLGFACRAPGVDAIVPVVYADEAFDGGTEPPGRTVIDAVVALARQHGFRVAEALCTAADGWGSFFDTELPPGGRPLDLIASVAIPVLDAPPAELGGVEPSAPDAATLAAVDHEYQELTTALETILEAATDRIDGTGAFDVLDVIERLDGLPDCFEAALRDGVDAMSAREVAFLLLALTRAWASDLALMQWAYGRELGEELDAAEREHGHQPIGTNEPDVFHRVAHSFVGDGPHPDVHRVRAAIVLLQGVVARAPEHARAAPLAMLAWLHWSLGQSSRAVAILDQLPEAERDHGLAPTIRSMVEQGHLPGWAFTTPSNASAVGRDARDQPAA